METELQADKSQWSSIVFSLDNEGFRKGFESGSRYYFVGTNREKPQRTASLYRVTIRETKKRLSSWKSM